MPSMMQVRNWEAYLWNSEQMGFVYEETRKVPEGKCHDRGYTQSAQLGQASVGDAGWGRCFREEVRLEGASLMSFICLSRSEFRRSLSCSGLQGKPESCVSDRILADS